MRDVNRKQGQNRNQRKHSFHRTLQKWYKKIQNIRLRYLRKSKGPLPESESTEEPIDNPWINDTRKIVEQILKQKGQTYRTFRPLIIDTDTPDQVFGEEDDVDRIQTALSGTEFPGTLHGPAGTFFGNDGMAGCRIRIAGKNASVERDAGESGRNGT